MLGRMVTYGISGIAFLGVAQAAEVLTPVATQTYALLYGSKAIYQDFSAGKATITEIDINSKAKKILLPDAGSSPYYIDYGWAGNDLAFIPFTIKAIYPLEYVDVNATTKISKSLSSSQGWKESVWVGGHIAVWVDYRHKLPNDKNGEIYMCSLPGGTEKRLTTDIAYEAKPATDGKHVVWMDYSAGTYANLVIYDIASGTTLKPSPTTSQQDNPRVDGDWVVWEDYRNAKSDTTNADIYAYNIQTKEVKPLCTQAAYQGKPFLQGNGVVWEDYRNTGSNKDNVDIYGYDLANNQEIAITTKNGYESSPVLYQNQITWFAIDGSVMNLYKATLAFNGPSTILPPSQRNHFIPEISDKLFQLNGKQVPKNKCGHQVSVMSPGANSSLLILR